MAKNFSNYYRRVYAKEAEYKGITFRSSMERDFAMFLDGQIVRYKGTNQYHEPIEWSYESQRFELVPQEEWFDRTERDKTLKKLIRNKKHTLENVEYGPDFYLPKYDLHIEIKGRQFDDALFHLRLRLFKHKFPTKAIWVIRHHEEFQNIDEVLGNIKIMN